MQKFPFCSIIVLNYNTRYLLENCFNALKNQDYPKDRYEVILVDNHSSDDSVEFTKKKFPWIKILLLDKNYGFAEGNNRGFEVAKGDYIIFLNTDTIVHNNWLSELVKVASSDKRIGICDSNIVDERYDRKSLGEGHINIFGLASIMAKTKEPKEIAWASGTSLLVKREVLKKLGYCFDPSFFAYYEDVDLSWRTWLQGYKIMYVPTSVVEHLGGKTSAKVKASNPLLMYEYRNKLWMYNKNLRLPLKEVALFFVALSTFLVMIKYILSRKWKFGIYPLRYVFTPIKENPALKTVSLKRQLQYFFV